MNNKKSPLGHVTALKNMVSNLFDFPVRYFRSFVRKNSRIPFLDGFFGRRVSENVLWT